MQVLTPRTLLSQRETCFHSDSIWTMGFDVGPCVILDTIKIRNLRGARLRLQNLL